MPNVPEDVDLVSSWEEVDAAAQAIANGVQRSQMAQSVRTSLGKADGALQPANQATKTAAMTQAVGVDANGKLWTTPGGSLSDDAKQRLLACFAHVAWADEHGQDYYDALEDALYPPADLVSITAVYLQDRPIYNTDDLDAIKASDDLTVIAHYSNGTSAVLADDDYTLSGTLTVGTSTITAAYGGKTATFDVTVTAAPLLPPEYQQVEWIQSDGNQVISTGVSIANNSQFLTYEVEADIAVPEPNATTGVLMGASSNGGYYLGNVANGAYVGLGPTSYFQNINIAERNTFVLSWTSSAGTAVCGDETITRTRTAQNQGQFAFFNDHQNLYGAKCRIYRAKLRQNGSEIRDLVPCYRKVDDVIGMYDIVNNVFYVNTGTGTFTKGANV